MSGLSVGLGTPIVRVFVTFATAQHSVGSWPVGQVQTAFTRTPVHLDFLPCVTDEERDLLAEGQAALSAFSSAMILLLYIRFPGVYF